ncbi:DUF89 family protein [bacterium]|nr:DUF89 family protein [bacterium]MBU1636994.1 DUF89 family protein [bacterium]MBU1919957.1 DUF89 family protein [bacterium]
MRTSPDCYPCFVRQAQKAAKMISSDAAVHEKIVRDVLSWTNELNEEATPPLLAQLIHRRLRELTGSIDPYEHAKSIHNQLALRLLPELRGEIEKSSDPLMTAVRLAIAGNIIDLGAGNDVSESDVRQSIHQALTEPFADEQEEFRQSVESASDILYLADNAGEIAFDRLLIEQLLPKKITLAVRGAPILNDATIVDARAVGLHELVEIIDNGSDAPGTILEDCNSRFIDRFLEADVIIAKGQGNYETLSDTPYEVYCLFKAKCPVVAAHVGLPVGTQVLMRSRPGFSQLKYGRRGDAK